MFTRIRKWYRLKYKATKNHVWYVGYGSNVNLKRFSYYIVSGIPEGSTKCLPGARDRTMPLVDNPIKIPFELYFAKHSDGWNGGVGFIKDATQLNSLSFARRYLVTKEQFEDIAKQETNSTTVLPINFKEAVANGTTIFKTPSWYGKVIFLGFYKGYPAMTLTSERVLTPTKPSHAYLETIAKGIRQVFSVNSSKLIEYFKSKDGIAGNYTESELKTVINNAIRK